MEERDIAIQIEGLRKRYRLGTIGGGTLRGDIESWWARKRGKEDPNAKIGAKQHVKNEVFYALDGIDLTIYKGERIGIIGHNGAGKSTLLKLLARVTAPTEGRICLDGRIASMLEVGMGFNGELTGRENIYLNGAILGMTKAEVDAKIEQIIDFSEVRQFIDTPVKRYSSGMYVKLAFSVAAHLDSEIMIMDEVLAVGDMAFQKKCLDKMKNVSLDEGRTVLYVSHNMTTIRNLCERCIVMNKGKVVYVGDVEKAIAIYLSNFDTRDLKCNYTFSNNDRKGFNPNGVRIRKLHILEKEKAVFGQSEEICMKVIFDALRSIDRVSMRFQLYLNGFDLLGSTFLDQTISVKESNEYSITFRFPVKNLIPGEYFADLVVFEHDGIGNARAVDIMRKCICFDVVNDIPDSLYWWTNPFGYVKFDNLSTIEMNNQEKKDV